MTAFSNIVSKYNKPFDTKYHVDTLLDATLADTDYNVPNMVIFVKDVKSFYYLKDGALGDNTSHWEKLNISGNGTFLPFVPSKPYVLGETASIGVNMFICIVPTSAGETPITDPNKWVQVGSSKKMTATFSNIQTLNINHTIPTATLSVFNSDGVEIEVLITKVTPTQFKIDSNQSISGEFIIQ